VWDNCAIENNKNASIFVLAGLITLQHREEESFGITISGEKKMRTFKSMGLVSISSKSSLINAQPFQINCIHDDISVTHNGNIVNFYKIKRMLLKKGAIFSHTSDTEILLHFMATSKGNFVDVVTSSLT
jgi:amidophosphoribosyltransferase